MLSTFELHEVIPHNSLLQKTKFCAHDFESFARVVCCVSERLNPCAPLLKWHAFGFKGSLVVPSLGILWTFRRRSSHFSGAETNSDTA